MAVVFSNNGKTTLSANVSSSATSISVSDGSVFPSLGSGEIFFCTLDDGTNNEIVKVTAISSNTLTVVRAQESTTARAFSAGDAAELRLTAGILSLFSQTGVVITDEVEAYLDGGSSTPTFASLTTGAISTSANLDMNANSIIDVEQINGTGGTGWLDFNMDADNVYPQASTDNQTVLGSITHMVFVGDSNSNGTGGIFYWGYGVSSSDSGTFTQTMALDRSGNLDLTGALKIGNTTVIGSDRDFITNDKLTFDYNDHYFQAGTNSISFKNSVGTSYWTSNNSVFTFNTSVDLNSDSAQLQFGADNDMQIFHNGAGGEINNATGNFTIDSAGDIILDVDGGDIKLEDAGVRFGTLSNSSTNLVIQSNVQDKDIIFKGNDGGSTITALTLDMSASGSATFNGSVTGVSSFFQNVYITSSGSTATNRLDNDGNKLYITYGGGSQRAIEVGNSNGEVKLKYATNTKLETTNGGVNITGNLRVSSDANDALIVGSGNESITFGGWDSGQSDISGLLAGSNFGSLITGGSNGHVVVGLRDNDANDSFSVISGAGDYMTGTTYDKLAFQVNTDGLTTVGNRLDVKSQTNTLQRWYKGSTLIGQAMAVSNVQMAIGSGDTGILFNNTTNEVYPWDVAGGAGSNNLLNLGNSTRKWKNLYVGSNIYVDGTVDGRDLQIDGNKLDNIEANATADQTASEILTAINTVDGSGSGLDADLLDGQHGSHYLNYNNLTNKPTIPTNNNQLTNGAGYITSADGGNAATLDSLDSTQFLRSDANDSYSGVLSLTGELTLASGSTRIDGSDGHPLVQVNSSRAYLGSTSRSKTVLASSDTIKHVRAGTEYTIWTEYNDGTGSGLDSDLLDGQHGSYYRNASNINAGTINTARLPNPIHLTGANAILKLQETGVTNNPTWWHVADGSSYSIRLNNTGPYPIQILTDSDNDAVTNIELNYTVDLGGNKLQFGSEATSYIQNVNKQGTDVWRLQTEDGRIEIGSENTSWAHLTTDRASFYMNPKLTVQGNVEPYTDSSHNLGANGLRWANAYVDNLIITNDGSGSGIDSDLLDGQHGSHYLDYNNFTNTPTIPSLSGYATESYVNTQVSNLVDSAPGTLNTLNELAAALGDDANFSTTVTNSIATKLPLAGGTMTGALNMNGNRINNVYTLQLRNGEISNFSGTRQMMIDANDSDSNIPAHGDYAGSVPFGIYFTGDNDSSTTTLGSGLVKVWHTGHFTKTHIDYFVGLYNTGVTTTEFDYLDGVTSNIQTQLNSKLSSFDITTQTDPKYLRSNAADTATGVITFAATPTLGGTSANEGGEINFGAPTGGGSSFALDNYQGHFRVHTLQSGKNFQVIGAGESQRTTINTNIGTVWGSNNDGSGSGLDADTLDGINSSSFLRSDTNDSLFSGNATLQFENQSSFARIAFYKLSLWEWNVGEQLVIDNGNFNVKSSTFTKNGNTVWHAGNDGSGSGLDADTLDGRDTSDTGGANKVMLSNSSSDLIVTGNVQHAGLSMTSGTDIDQLKTVNVTATLSTSWQDTGIDGADLSTGTYIVQVYVNDSGVGGNHYTEYYSGTMSWYQGNTNSTVTDEIPLHRAGHAPNAGDFFLRTQRTVNADSHDLMLQMRGSTSNTGNSTYVFKFRRMI